MSMTGSMCVSMTGRPTFAQRQNEQRRQSYGYYQVAKAIKERSNGNAETNVNGNPKGNSR